jgi:hypothetical protein
MIDPEKGVRRGPGGGRGLAGVQLEFAPPPKRATMAVTSEPFRGGPARR